MAEREGTRWICRGVSLDLSRRTLIMGVLNVTPDSFSDGGQFATSAEAIRRGLALAAEGADILDIGGESTRPGSQPVSEDEEIRRVLPIVEGLVGRTSALISVDTSKPGVAGRALDAGAHIINDVTACSGSPDMAAAIASSGAGVVLMHMQGTPATMQQAPVYDDVVSEVGLFLRERVKTLTAAGVNPEAIVVDPGIGFGKTDAHNLALLASLDRLRAAAGRPVLIGVSRKGFIGRLLDRPESSQRLAGSLAILCHCMQRGASVVRVHDVKESCDAARMMAMLHQTEVRGWSG